MVEGPSGILQACPPWERPVWNPSRGLLTWPEGAKAKIYSGDEPKQLRGPQHDTAWCDEPAHYQYPRETWDNLMFGLRGDVQQSQCCATTTPLPIKLIKSLLDDQHTVVTRAI